MAAYVEVVAPLVAGLVLLAVAARMTWWLVRSGDGVNRLLLLAALCAAALGLQQVGAVGAVENRVAGPVRVALSAVVALALIAYGAVWFRERRAARGMLVFSDRRERHRQVWKLHNVVDAMTVAKYALEEGANETALRALDRALRSAAEISHDLLSPQGRDDPLDLTTLGESGAADGEDAEDTEDTEDTITLADLEHGQPCDPRGRG